jgi:hypothetical protein
MKKRKCAECKRVFKPVREYQLYCSRRCKNRAGSRRLRERAKNYVEMVAEHGGVMGGND